MVIESRLKFLLNKIQLQPYVCEMPLDVEKCVKNNIHKRTEEDIRSAMNQWVPTPATYTLLEYDCLFNSDNTDQVSDMDEGDQDDKGDTRDGISDDGNENAEKELDEFSGDDESMNEVSYFCSIDGISIFIFLS